MPFDFGEFMLKLPTILHHDHLVPRRRLIVGKLMLKFSTIRHDDYVEPRRLPVREWYTLGILSVGRLVFWLLVCVALYRIGGIMP